MLFRNFLSSIKLTNNPHDYYQLVQDNRIEIVDSTAVSDSMMRVTYRTKKDFVEEHSVSNVVLALWTTSAARVYLYKQMKKIVSTPNCQLLYTDTDSVIFVHPENVMPIKIGNLLGEMSDEYPEYNIVEWASAGCKQARYSIHP